MVTLLSHSETNKKNPMKKASVVICLLLLHVINACGQWYVKKYNVTDIDYLTQQQLKESIKDTRTSVYVSLGCAGAGGLVILFEKLMPYKEEDDDNVTILEALLGEKGVHQATIAAGAGLIAGGAIASIVYLARLGTIRSTLNRNFPSSGSLNLSPTLIQDRYSHVICPGLTLTFNF
jgi:hypothetical protein